MAKRLNGTLYMPPDLSNDLSDSSSEDSYELNMQRVPDVPMPDFKKPLQSLKLFERKPPSVLRVRKSAIMNALGGYKQMIASTPMNPTSATTTSEISLLQFSPITGTAKKNINESQSVNNKHARDDANVTSIDKPVNDNKLNIRSTHYENLSKKKQNKHVSASVKAVADHLLSISETLRKEHEGSTLDGKKDWMDKNKSNNKGAPSVPNKHKKQITEQSSNTLKESLNKQLYQNKENDLAGIEILNFSSEDDAANRAKSAVELCRYSRLPTRKTILMERQTQTTDSLEKLFKKNSAAPSPLVKEAEEIEKEVHSANRKIIEPDETSSIEKKISKTVVNQLAGKKKQNSTKIQINKHTETQNSTSSLVVERHEQEPQVQEFQRSMQNDLNTDAQTTRTTKFSNAGLHNSVEDEDVEEFLERFDQKNTVSIVSISSTSEITLEKSSDNFKTSVSSSNKRLENSRNTAKSEKVNVPVNATTCNKTSETLQSSVIQIFHEKSTSGVHATLRKKKSSEIIKQNSNQEPTKDSRKVPVEITALSCQSNDNYENIKDSETVDEIDIVTRKRGRPKVSKTLDINTESSNSISKSLSTTKKHGQTKKNGVLQQSIQISKEANKRPRGRPKGSKNKNRILLQHFIHRPSGFVQVRRDYLIQNNADNCRGENEPKRQRQPTAQYIQELFTDDKVMRKSTVPKPKKSIVAKPKKCIMPKPKKCMLEKSKKQLKSKSDDQNSPIENFTTDNIAKALEYDIGESLQTNTDEPSTSMSVDRSNLKEPTIIVKALDSSKNKSRSTSKNKTIFKSITKNKNNQKSVAKITDTNTVLDSIYSAVISPLSKDVSVSEKSVKNKRNSKNTSQPVRKSYNTRNSNCDASGSSKKNQSNNNQTAEYNNFDVENIESPMGSPSYEPFLFSKTSNKGNNKKQNTSIKTLGNNYDLENINAEIDSGVGYSLPKDPTATICPAIVVHENISIQPSSRPGLQTSKDSKDCNKKIVTFTEPSTQISENNQHAVSQTVFPLNRRIDSQSCLVDSTRAFLHADDWSSETSTENQTVHETGRSNILHTIVNNEVEALEWVAQPRELNTEPLTSGMAVKVSLKNLKSACSTSSCGHIVFAPNYRKPWQISKKHCIMYKVEKGEALVRVQGKKKIVGVGYVFYIPLGAEYTITNLKAEPLILFFHKSSP